MTYLYSVPSELVLGTRFNELIPEADQLRQRGEVDDLLQRLRTQPGIILADEVGMGKTFVALAVVYAVAVRSVQGPVVVMVPANLVAKWEQDLKTFCELYLDDRRPVRRDEGSRSELTSPDAIRYGVARHSIEFMRLLDDRAPVRCQVIFLAHGSMSRSQTDKWVRLALISETLRRHARSDRPRLVQVRGQIHRFLARLLSAVGEERAHEWHERLWQVMLENDSGTWKDVYNCGVRQDRQLKDDPVPKSVGDALTRMDLGSLAVALENMPVRARGGEERLTQRLGVARVALRRVEDDLWKELLTRTRWRSPLLVMDEAHHLKNPGTALARTLQSPDVDNDLRTGDGAMARAFDRMLFLTATPFQLGHRELVSVLRRFGDVRWQEDALGDREVFQQQLAELELALDESQRTAVALQRAWSRLDSAACSSDVDKWWADVVKTDLNVLDSRVRAVVNAFRIAKKRRDAAEKVLRPWVLRYNKGALWAGTAVARRRREDGGAIVDPAAANGIAIPPQQLLPFFLAARSVVRPGKDLLGEALSSSYEAFRFTRDTNSPEKDDQEGVADSLEVLSLARWYLAEFDCALGHCTGAMHPKVDATVRKTVDLWQAGEKVLVFAFYRQTCRALRLHISREIERRLMSSGQDRLREGRTEGGRDVVERLLETVQRRYFDDADAPGRRAVDAALADILGAHRKALDAVGVSTDERALLTDVMRRFLRASTTLARCFPLAEIDTLMPDEAVAKALDHIDISKTSWRDKFQTFVSFLTDSCSTEERSGYLEAARRTQTGGIRVEGDEEDETDGELPTLTVANVQVATGATRRDARVRLMRAFNTPFFPDILVCSEVMGEGVDLQRFCRHVIHHDLAWNPSSIEQRTGRIDRLGCKAQGKDSIVVYVPYLAGTADERQYRVMTDREKWFRVVMGQDEVARLITPDTISAVLLPEAVANELAFKLDLADGRT